MWLLTQSVHDAMHHGSASAQFTPEQVQAFAFDVQAAGTSKVMTTAGSTAEIHVHGVLTNTPDLMAEYFGGGNTTYPNIIAALAEADANPDVEQITMRFDSPGGSVMGMFDAIAAIKNTTKHVKAVVGSMATSAAYGLASQADEIVAHDRASMVGSIGVVTGGYINKSAVTLTSTNAPDKRPDLETDAGKATVVKQLDDVAALLDDAISEGRGVSIEKINADFGKGGVLLSNEALERGMIDSIRAVSTNTNPVASGGKQETKAMLTLAALKAEHPEAFAAAVEETLGAERDRVNAHLTMGASSGDMTTAVEAVKAGTAMTATLQATYMSAGMNRADVEARAADDADAAKTDNTQDVGATAEAAASQRLLEAAAEHCGVELNV